MEQTLITASISFGVLFGYVIVKKIARSHCHSDSGCIECDTPAVEVQRENTTRIENMEKFMLQFQTKTATPREFKFPDSIV